MLNNNISKQNLIFSFVTKKNEKNQMEILCYCYGNSFGTIYKSGAMRIIKSPFLINIFINMINNLSNKYELYLVSNLDSIVCLNNYLNLLKINCITNIIDIDSCMIIWNHNIEKSQTPIVVLDHKQIYKNFISYYFHYPNHKIFIFKKEHLDNMDEQNKHMLLQGMTYALDFPLDAVKIISKQNGLFDHVE